MDDAPSVDDIQTEDNNSFGITEENVLVLDIHKAVEMDNGIAFEMNTAVPRSSLHLLDTLDS